MKRKLLGILLFTLHSFAVFVLPVLIHFGIDKLANACGNHVIHLLISISALVIQAVIVFYAVWKKDNWFSRIVNKYLK